MMNPKESIWLLILILPAIVQAQGVEHAGKAVPDTFCISRMEYKLYNMVNAYRERYDLPGIPLSKSLCFVASEHVKDLILNHPDNGKCNAHSWSDKGQWKPFCYPRDENKKNSVWDKPKELTSYHGKGYEIVYYENEAVVIDSIITFWKSMDYFNSFLMNTGKWQGKKWHAIGVGIYQNYACAWFGELPDQEGIPVVCGESGQKAPIIKDYGSDNEEITPLKESSPDKKKSVKTEPLKSTSVQPVPKIPSTPVPHSQAKADKDYYYIIIKGIAPEKELQTFLKDVQAKGYTTARLIDLNGKKRVSVQEYDNKSKADSALRHVRKTWPDAWILKP